MCSGSQSASGIKMKLYGAVWSVYRCRRYCIHSPIQILKAQQSGSIECHNETSDDVADLLATGFVDLYRPSLSKIENDLKELTNKQEKIHEDLGTELQRISDDKLTDIKNMATKMKNYKEKLVFIKKQMVHIHHRTRNLKRRSLTLQTFKQAEIDAKIQKRNREEHLIGGASSNDSPTLATTNTP